MKEKVLKAFVWVCLGCSLVSCDEEIPGEYWEAGYFGEPYTSICQRDVPAEAGAKDFTLTGTKTEMVIPLVLIANEEDDIHKTRYNWETRHSQGEVYLPDLQYAADGYKSYPNTLDYTYRFKWATFSTVKEPGAENGLLRVSYEANPYNVPRQIVAYLENEDNGTLILCQMSNPDGIDPPGEPLEEWECYIGPYFPPTE